jgi:CO/xanthine dehydrogenase Mo-binding subunit
MLMAATDCLTHDPHADRKAIEDALGGVLCRCTGYLKIVEAVMGVASVGGSEPSPPGRKGRALSAVGARLPRVDGRAKVDGTDIFGADAAPPGALWMRVVRSPHARATFSLGDLDSVIRRTPGLAAILTTEDIPGENSFGIFAHLRDQPVLAPGYVRFRGEAVLAPVGTREAVDRISDADLPIRWMKRDPLLGVDAALADTAEPLHPHAPDNVLTRGNLKCGDVAAGHSGAAATAEGRFETSFVEHAYIEPEAGYAIEVDGRIEVAACTQTPYMDRAETARVLGVQRRRCASARRSAAASAESSTSRCSRCWPSPRV